MITYGSDCYENAGKHTYSKYFPLNGIAYLKLASHDNGIAKTNAQSKSID
jgi:hypothetical protein